MDGITKLINLLGRMAQAGGEDTSPMATGIRCLSSTFLYLSGVNYLRQRPHLFTKLFDLLPVKAGVANNSNPFEVRKLVINIFISLCKCMKGSFDCINRAAVNTARRANQSPYSSLLACLALNDLELKIGVLTLINWLLFKCPSEKKLCKFLSRMENMGVYDDLRALAKERNPEILTQLKNFQKNAKIIIPSLQYEIEIHKNRSKELQEHCDNLERKIEHYAEQQSLFKLMRDDLENYKKVAQMSKELATYYSPFTPLTQYKQEVLIKLPQIKSEIIDLKEAMLETSQNIDSLKKRIKELESANYDLNNKNELSIKRQEELAVKLVEVQGQNTEMQKKSFEEIPRLRDKLEKAETSKSMLDKKLGKVERELKEYQDLTQGQKETIKNLYEQKKEIIYVDKNVPGKLKDTDLAAFVKKCETLNQICDTMDLVFKTESSVNTDPVEFGSSTG